ncbi:hypothetical protein NDU88_006510 [Pleurodeles waltl]|uniref:Uncharacterized protein n=1 Tax=Pleurodeles waltl TaxID=8319 RepID=A0AAV7PIY0_PLEWA|nr:hypothetical protein NDU88_006510 [Pleurodeles waltl]
MEDKHTALDQNCKFGSYVSLAGEHGTHGGGVTIPSMFKARHSLESSAGNVPIASSNPESLRDRAVVVAEVADISSDLAIPVFPTQNKVLLQIDAITDNNGPLDINNLVGGLSMASLCFSAPSASGDNQQLMPEGNIYQQSQGFSSSVNVKHAQNPQIEHHDLAAARLSTAAVDLLTPACNLRAIRNSRQGKEDCHVVIEAAENFYSLWDQSRDSDDSSNSSALLWAQRQEIVPLPPPPC